MVGQRKRKSSKNNNKTEGQKKDVQVDNRRRKGKNEKQCFGWGSGVVNQRGGGLEKKKRYEQKKNVINRQGLEGKQKKEGSLRQKIKANKPTNEKRERDRRRSIPGREKKCFHV